METSQYSRSASFLYSQFLKIAEKNSLKPVERKLEGWVPISSLDFQKNGLHYKVDYHPIPYPQEVLYAIVELPEPDSGILVKWWDENPSYRVSLDVSKNLKLSNLGKYLESIEEDLAI